MFKSKTTKVLCRSLQLTLVAPLFPVFALAWVCKLIEPEIEEGKRNTQRGWVNTPTNAGPRQSTSESFLTA